MEQYEHVAKKCKEMIRKFNSRLDAASAYSIDQNCIPLLHDYLIETSAAILEEATLVARHRKASKVEASDITLILAKKFEVCIPGSQRISVLDKNSFKLHKFDENYSFEDDIGDGVTGKEGKRTTTSVDGVKESNRRTSSGEGGKEKEPARRKRKVIETVGSTDNQDQIGASTNEDREKMQKF